MHYIIELLVAASAARRPVSSTRGRRSNFARSRRWCEWLMRQAVTSKSANVHSRDRSDIDNSCIDDAIACVSQPQETNLSLAKPERIRRLIVVRY